MTCRCAGKHLPDRPVDVVSMPFVSSAPATFAGAVLVGALVSRLTGGGVPLGVGTWGAAMYLRDLRRDMVSAALPDPCTVKATATTVLRPWIRIALPSSFRSVGKSDAPSRRQGRRCSIRACIWSCRLSHAGRTCLQSLWVRAQARIGVDDVAVLKELALAPMAYLGSARLAESSTRPRHPHRPQQSQQQPPRSHAPEQPDPHGPQRTRPPPYPHQRLGNGGRVGQHADCTVDLGEIAVRHHLRGLVADAQLEASRAPVNELDGTLGLEGGDGSVGVLGHDITTVEQASGHVLAVARVTLDHLVVGLEAGHGDLLDAVRLREVNTRVRDQVGLELVQVDVEGAVKAERGGDRGDDLGDQAVQVLVVGTLDAEVASANVVNGLVVDHERAVGVLKGGVGELQLALLAVVHRQTLHQQSTETRASTATERVEDEETLETRAVVCYVPDLVEDLVDQLLTDRVVATGVVVRGILLARDHLLRVEKAAVGASADLVDDVRLEIAVDESRETLVVIDGLAVLAEEAIRLDTVLEAVELLPALVSVRDLATRLADCTRESFVVCFHSFDPSEMTLSRMTDGMELLRMEQATALYRTA
ncbi:Tubulin alpha [Hortaea werneckii]|nr:Tubulin alpha [Hortaea werneckii]